MYRQMHTACQAKEEPLKKLLVILLRHSGYAIAAQNGEKFMDSQRV